MARLEELLAQLDPDEYRRGKQFERIVKWFLDHAPEYETLLRRVWPWDDWPDRWSRDLGIDLVAEDRDGGVWAIQAKAYVPDHSVTKRDVDSFLSASASKRFSYRLLVATTDRVAANARQTIEEQAIPVGMLLRSDLGAAELNWPSSPSRLVAAKPPRKKLRPHQRRAVRDVVRGFTTTSRGQMIMACGTGKTLAALGVHERLDSKRTLVLVPSLSLLSQTLREWNANARERFEYLAVCSDETVSDPDAPVSTTHDLGVPVTTDANDIAAFLRRRTRRVVFSTYQSSPQIAAAYRKHYKSPAFDLVICDEAHRCAGPVSSDFATILDAKKISGKRRLFMTATPRYFTGRIRRAADEADFEIASMDDEGKFGPAFHRLTFAQAIGKDLLSDYQVVIVGVDDATYRDWAEHGKFVTRDGKKITDARTLAGQIGLAKAMRKFDLGRVITFHSRVAAARNFSTELPDVIAWMPSRQRPSGTIQAAYVSGVMPTGERRRRLGRLANPHPRSRALLSNARCLAEGIDVPTLDGVAFIDPRRSEVEIVQAVGRAIRKAADKKIGTIVIPVFIGDSDDPEQTLQDSAFRPVWGVVRALRAHDEELAEQLDTIRRELGRRAGSAARAPSKLRVDLPADVSVDFARAFDVRVVERTTSPWEESLGRLLGFVDREGHARVPDEYRDPDGYVLGAWVQNQRIARRVGRLSTERAAQLDALPGWSWGPRDDAWDQGVQHLQAYASREGDALVARDHIESGYPLGAWVQKVRSRRDRLPPERIAQLEALSGWTWDARDAAWEDGFRRLEAFVDREGHARVPVGYCDPDGFALGRWVRKRRPRGQEISPDQIARLEALPDWSWAPHRDRWEEGFERLNAFVHDRGHAHVPQSYLAPDGFGLGRWVTKQRHVRTQLTTHQRTLLSGVPGWSWDPRDDTWEEAFLRALAYVEREGDARIPDNYRDSSGYSIGRWAGRQRRAYRHQELSADRAARLAALPGWSWTPPFGKRNTALRGNWQANFADVRAFSEAHGHLDVPETRTKKSPLASWIRKQRAFYRRGLLSAHQIELLESVKGWTWEPRDSKWEAGFRKLAIFAAREGHTRVATSHMEDGFRLGQWVGVQRSSYRAGRLDPVRAAKLEALPGWSWNSRQRPNR